MRYVFALVLSLLASPAFAGVSCVLPFNLQNGTTADATQVMANYNALVACLGNAAAAGANSDITSLNGLTTPIPHSAGGTPVYIGGTSAGTANAQTLGSTVPGFILAAGNIVTFVAGFSPTSAMTMNIAATGAVNVYRKTQLGIQPFVGGEFVAGDEVTLQYDGTQFQCLSCKKDIVGEIMDFAGAAIPAGWLAMDGSCQSQTTFAALFSAIGSAFGSCSAGSFALPDGRGNAMVGTDNQGGNGNANRLSLCGGHTVVGTLCGIQAETVGQANLPNITLSPSSLTGAWSGTVEVCNTPGSCNPGDTAFVASSTRLAADPTSNYITSPIVTFGGNIPLGGSGTALTTIQPVQFVFKIIKL